MQAGKYMHDWTIQKYGMVMDRMVKNEHLPVVFRWWIRKGRWRSYNTVMSESDNVMLRTTALGNVEIRHCNTIRDGIKNGSFIWKMK